MKKVWVVVLVLLFALDGISFYKQRHIIRDQQQTINSLVSAAQEQGVLLQEKTDKLAVYEAPYDELLVIKEKPQPDKACTRCCCGKNLPVCHRSCARFNGGHDAMCSGLCAMKARGIPMPMEH